MIERPEDLSAFLDGELPDSEALEIEIHLTKCEECQTELAGLRAARAAVRGLPMLSPPDDVFEFAPPAVALPAAELPAAGLQGAERHQRGGPARVWMPVAAAVAALAIWAGLVSDPISNEIELATVASQHATSSAGQPGSLLIAVPLEGITP